MTDPIEQIFGKVERLDTMTIVTPAIEELPTITPSVTVAPAPRKIWQGLKQTVAAHTHAYTKHIALRDRYIDGTRYILAHSCECGDYKAYDLSNELPRKEPV